MEASARRSRGSPTEGATFISRGDDSGTHKFELKLWEEAGEPAEGSWYQESGQGMGATLRIADDKGGYTITDRGTHLATNSGGELVVLVEGGPALLNVYHVIDITTKAGERVNAAGGKAFADWIVAPAGAADDRCLRDQAIRRTAVRARCRQDRRGDQSRRLMGSSGTRWSKRFGCC